MTISIGFVDSIRLIDEGTQSSRHRVGNSREEPVRTDPPDHADNLEQTMHRVEGTDTIDRSLNQGIRRIELPFSWRSTGACRVYLLLRRVPQPAAGSSNDLNSDIEVVVLRHQLMVLHAESGFLDSRFLEDLPKEMDP
jgi:hypothetical protein